MIVVVLGCRRTKENKLIYSKIMRHLSLTMLVVGVKRLGSGYGFVQREGYGEREERRGVGGEETRQEKDS